MPRVSLCRLRDEILAIYQPPAGAKNSWYKFRQVLNILAELGVKSTYDLTPDLIPKFTGFNPDWKIATTRGLLGYLSPICGYAQTMKYLKNDVNPFAIKRDWLKAPELDLDDDDQADDDWDWDAVDGMPAHLPIADLARLLDYLEEGSASWKGARLYALIATYAYTGLRRNEALTRTVKDFNLDRRVMRITARRKRLKTAASNRPVGLPTELVPILRDWLPRTGSRWAFPGVSGKGPWLNGSIGRRPLDELQAAAKACGIARCTFQMLRHSWATHAELRGIGELMVARQLRHTSVRTQQHYRHEDIANLADAVKGFSLRSKQG